jgi:hypothetical protein
MLKWVRVKNTPAYYTLASIHAGNWFKVPPLPSRKKKTNFWTKCLGNFERKPLLKIFNIEIQNLI